MIKEKQDVYLVTVTVSIKDSVQERMLFENLNSYLGDLKHFYQGESIDNYVSFNKIKLS